MKFTEDITARESQTYANYEGTGRVHLTCPRCGTSNVVSSDRLKPVSGRRKDMLLEGGFECWKCDETVDRAVLKGIGSAFV